MKQLSILYFSYFCSPFCWYLKLVAVTEVAKNFLENSDFSESDKKYCSGYSDSSMVDFKVACQIVDEFWDIKTLVG